MLAKLCLCFCPDYVGKSYEEVVTAVEADSNLSLKVSADGEFSDTVAEGNVISQQPSPGEPMTSGSAIIYVVLSKGPQLKILPDVKDKSVSAAAEKLTDLGFVVVQEVEYDSEVPEGKVIDYADHDAGDKIESGSALWREWAFTIRRTFPSNLSQPRATRHERFAHFLSIIKLKSLFVLHENTNFFSRFS